MFSIFNPFRFLGFSIAPVIPGGASPSPAGPLGWAYLKYGPKFFNWLGGKRNTESLVPGVSFPGYTASGSPIDDSDKYNFADFTWSNSMPTQNSPIISTTPKGGGPDWTKWIPPINVNFPRGTPGINPGASTPGQTQGGGSNLPQGMEWLLPILAAAAGGLQNRSQTAESHATNTPQYGPKEEEYKNSLMQKYMEYLNQDPDLKGYEANQLSQINKAYGERQTNVAGDLSARGITGPAAELAKTGIGNQQFQESTQLRNNIPLLAQNMRGQALSNATGFFNALPYGNQIDSTQKQSGNILGGITGGFAEALAALYGIKLGRT